MGAGPALCPASRSALHTAYGDIARKRTHPTLPPAFPPLQALERLGAQRWLGWRGKWLGWWMR